MHTSSVTIHMVSSLDGFVAKADGKVDWLTSKDQYRSGISLTNDQINEFVSEIDCYVMGSKTYQHALDIGWPYGETPVYVLTKQKLLSNRENVEFHSTNLNYLVNQLLKPIYGNIWVVGGPKLVKSFIQAELVDEIIVSIMPIILGGGTPFFDCVGIEKQLHLKETTAYQDGMVELHYEVP